jgi:hypothetical protein
MSRSWMTRVPPVPGEAECRAGANAGVAPAHVRGNGAARPGV